MKTSPLFLLLFSPVAVCGGDTAAAVPVSKRPFDLTQQKDIPLLCAGIAFSAAAFVIERSTAPLTREEVNSLSRSSVNSLDQGATYHYSASIDNLSDILVDGVLVLPLGLLTSRNIRRGAAEISLMYAEVVAFAYALPALGKGFFKRPRPFVYNPAVPLDEKLSRDSPVSFFSRHTTFAFASACFMSTAYGAYNPGSKLTPYIWIAALGAASTVGYLRFAAGAHFPTDILTGALAGTLVGCGVPFLHTSKKTAERLSLNPSSDGLCLSLAW